MLQVKAGSQTLALIIALALVLVAFIAATPSNAQDKASNRPSAPAGSKDTDNASTSAPVGGSGAAGQPTAGGGDADSGVSKAPQNPGSRSK